MNGIVGLLLLALTEMARPTGVRGVQFDLTELGIEELMNIEVVSVAKKEQAMFEAAAAVFVLTAEDLRRSGVTNIPEALRLVPGMQVGRVDANKWAISARGFNDQFANKLLVLTDGRSVYTPVFSGVFWEAQDVVLEDVERIEVIRGPGGSLWGANAVNGVINILTKEAQDSQGGFVQIGGGSQEQGFATVRYGGKAGKNGHFRIYAKRVQRDGLEDAAGRELGDGWRIDRGGGRLDWRLSDRDALTLQGDAYRGEMGETVQIVTSLETPYVERFVDEFEVEGGNALARWKRRWGEEAELELQIYFDRVERRSRPVDGWTQIFDVDVQHRFGPTRKQEIVWGLGGRFIRDYFKPLFTLSFDPPSRNTHILSAFVQNDIALDDKRLHLIVGTKLEHNTYTGFEIQPNARLVWIPTRQHALWGAISRAVRTPSRSENDQRARVQVLPPGQLTPESPLALVAVWGNRDFVSEDLLAFDLGYRTYLGNELTLDLATFYNIYDDLRTNEPSVPLFEETPPPAHMLVPIVAQNRLHGVTYGAEAAVNWQLFERWHLHAAYTYLQMDMELDKDSVDLVATTWDVENPNHQLSVRSSWDATRRLRLDIGVRYMDELPILQTDSYLTMDFRLGWQPVDRLEFFLAGQNLLDSPHLEFPRQMVITVPGTMRAGMYAGLSWKF